MNHAAETRFSNPTLAVLPFEEQTASGGSAANKANNLTEGVIDELDRMGKSFQ